jgi:hypothetical protein
MRAHELETRVGSGQRLAVPARGPSGLRLRMPAWRAKATLIKASKFGIQ